MQNQKYTSFNFEELEKRLLAFREDFNKFEKSEQVQELSKEEIRARAVHKVLTLPLRYFTSKNL